MSSNPAMKSNYSHVTAQVIYNDDGTSSGTKYGAQPTRSLLQKQNRTIISVCCMVIFPMTIFTAIIMWMILAHQVDVSSCPYPDLCMSAEQLNRTHFGPADYLVDFPAARLVFIASWSSTLSFTFIGCIMVLYGYIAANRLLHLSDAYEKEHAHPSPYHITLLIRILNADLVVIWDIVFERLKNLFRKRTRSRSAGRVPRLLATTVMVFSFSILCSLAIQLTDTYLHIATKAIDMVEAQPAPSADHYYSQGFNEPCLERGRSTHGLYNNSDYWGCVVKPDEEEDVGPRREGRVSINSLELKISKKDDYLTWKSEDGSDMAILGPRSVTKDADYIASSFGLSTQCRAVLNTSCTMSGINKTSTGYPGLRFNCTKERAGLDAVGTYYPLTGMVHFLDYHRFAEDVEPFNLDFNVVTNKTREAAAALSIEDGKSVFRNPWNWISTPAVNGKYIRDMWYNKTHPYLWKNIDQTLFMFLHCNSTVHDVKYSFINGVVTVLDRVLSNSSTTGVSSMTMSPYYNVMLPSLHSLELEADMDAPHPVAFVQDFARIASQKFLTPFAGVTELRPALQVQTRAVKVLTRVPKIAIWLLIVANMIFALFAFVVAIFALMAASADVHQVQARLSISGLAAQLFEQKHVERRVDRTADLFGRHAEDEYGGKERRVRIQRTETGGTVYHFK